MDSRIIQRIIGKSGVPELLEVLTERLSPTDLQSLLLEVYALKSQSIRPPEIFSAYLNNRFVQPSKVTPQKLMALSRICFEQAIDFESVELSPLSPLGACSALGTVHQNKVISTIRNTEVSSDNTNLMALECARRRRALTKGNPKDNSVVRLCSSQRLVRAQHFDNPDFFPHFRIFSMCSAGRDRGDWRFEKAELIKHISVYLRIFEKFSPLGYSFSDISVGLTPLQHEAKGEEIGNQVLDALKQEHTDIRFYLNKERQSGRGYYHSFSYNIDVTNSGGTTFSLGDGGFTNWTSSMLSNSKERLLISALGIELIGNSF